MIAPRDPPQASKVNSFVVRFLYAICFILSVIYIRWIIHSEQAEHGAPGAELAMLAANNLRSSSPATEVITQPMANLAGPPSTTLPAIAAAHLPVSVSHPEIPPPPAQPIINTAPVSLPPPATQPVVHQAVSPRKTNQNIRQTLSAHLANSSAYQMEHMHNRLANTPHKTWLKYHLEDFAKDEEVFSDVCYEWSTQSNSFVFRQIFKTGEDVVFNKEVGVEVGRGGRHAILDQGIASTHAPKEQRSHPATEGQDLLVLELTGGKRNGYFVDLAARYWHRGSNSFLLENYYQWRGICIEPDNNFARGLVVNRTCLVVCNNPVTDRNGDLVRFNYKINGANSRGNEDGTKATVTLSSILDAANAPPQMDYLSLDVEDHEWTVMSKFNFDRYKFAVMTVERPTQELHGLLSKHGYRWLTQLPGNFGETVYLHKSNANLVEKMRKYRPAAKHFWRHAAHLYMLQPAWDAASGTFKE